MDKKSNERDLDKKPWIDWHLQWYLASSYVHHVEAKFNKNLVREIKRLVPRTKQNGLGTNHSTRLRGVRYRKLQQAWNVFSYVLRTHFKIVPSAYTSYEGK